MVERVRNRQDQQVEADLLEILGDEPIDAQSLSPMIKATVLSFGVSEEKSGDLVVEILERFRHRFKEKKYSMGHLEGCIQSAFNKAEVEGVLGEVFLAQLVEHIGFEVSESLEKVINI